MTRTETRQNRIERHRLLSRLADDVDGGCDVLVLSAAPGSGKTTLLEQWLGARRVHGDIVLALDVGQADRAADLLHAIRTAARESVPASLVAAVTAALEKIIESDGSAPGRDDLGTAVGTCVWVALDNAQDCASGAAAQQVRRLLAAAAPELRIAIAGRYTPSGLLSQMLLEGRAKEYRIVDLAFDRDEARELLALEAVDVSDGDLDSLLERTAGWAAGLRLAAMAMSRDADHAGFVRTFAGTDRSVSDYLVSALLSGMPAAQLEVLLDVSVAERVNLDLARLLTGRPEAGAVLDELVARNALVATARHDPDWYEIHPLLRGYLRAALRRRDMRRFRQRQATAVEWFEAIGDASSAIQHAAAARDWPRVEALIATYAVHLVMTDGPTSMREIWQGLPARLQSRPSVAFSAALIASLEDSPAAADLEISVLDAAEDDPPRLLALRAISTLAGSRLRPIDLRAVRDAIASLDLVDGIDADLAILGRSQATMALGMAGDLDDARATGVAVNQLCRTRGLDYTQFRTLIALTAVCTFGSDYAGASTYGKEAIELAGRRGWDSDPRLTSVHGQLAMAAWLGYDDSSAAHHALRAVEVSDAETDPVSARAAVCQYDIMAVTPTDGLDLRVLAHLRAFNEMWPGLPPLVVSLNACFEVVISLRHHELVLAGEVIREVEELMPDAAEVAMLRAMRHVYQGHGSLARQELDAALADAGAFLSPWSAATAWALAAHVADSAGEPARAHDALVNAIETVEPVGLARVLLEATPSIRVLLQRNQGRFGRHEGYVADMLAAAERHSASPGSGVALTEKELMVVRDLPSLLSLREIAAAHVVSVNTIKTHMKSVYRKLGAGSRREAVEHARRLGLI